MDLDSAQIEKLIAGLPADQQADLLSLLEELETRKLNAAAQMDFLAFIARVDRNYKFGIHLKRLGHLLMDVEEGMKDRIAVSMAPRFG